jgi:predicted AAA+ superfamily ATPase
MQIHDLVADLHGALRSQSGHLLAIERPQVGASFEGFVIEQAIQLLGARGAECHHWATPQGAELDLLVARGDRRIGIEVKCTQAPRGTRSMEIAMTDLELDRLWVEHQGEDRFEMRPGIEALPVSALEAIAAPASKNRAPGARSRGAGGSSRRSR